MLEKGIGDRGGADADADRGVSIIWQIAVMTNSRIKETSKQGNS